MISIIEGTFSDEIWNFYFNIQYLESGVGTYEIRGNELQLLAQIKNDVLVPVSNLKYDDISKKVEVRSFSYYYYI